MPNNIQPGLPAAVTRVDISNTRARAGSHESHVPSHLRSIRAILAVHSMKVGTYHFTWGPKYDMDVYMATLFGGEARDLC